LLNRQQHIRELLRDVDHVILLGARARLAHRDEWRAAGWT
jgi:hypothetical protein